MPGIEVQRSKDKEMLTEVALRYASQHGLRPDKIEWVKQDAGVKDSGFGDQVQGQVLP